MKEGREPNLSMSIYDVTEAKEMNDLVYVYDRSPT